MIVYNPTIIILQLPPDYRWAVCPYEIVIIIWMSSQMLISSLGLPVGAGACIIHQPLLPLTS